MGHVDKDMSQAGEPSFYRFCFHVSLTSFLLYANFWQPFFIETVRIRVLFSSRVRVYRKSYCTTPAISIGICGGSGRVSKMLKFNFEVLQVVGKVLSGQLFCMETSLVFIVNFFSSCFTKWKYILSVNLSCFASVYKGYLLFWDEYKNIFHRMCWKYQ